MELALRRLALALNGPLVAARETLQVGDDVCAVRGDLDTNAVAQALGTRKSFRRWVCGHRDACMFIQFDMG